MSRAIGSNVGNFCSKTYIQVHANRRLRARIQLDRRYGWGPPDGWLKWCRELNVPCLPILKWEKPRPTDPNEWGEWHAFVEEAVRRYKDQRHWQVWNEPNNSRAENGAWLFPTPRSYRDFVGDTAETIKRINPNAVVVAGGIAYGGYGAKTPRDDFDLEWFKQYPIVDRVAVHTYLSTSAGAAQAINNVRHVSEQPVWCTELGRRYTTEGWDEARQALWFDRVDAGTPTVPKWWFRFKDGEGDPIFNGFGAVRPDWTPRPVWKALARAAA